MTLQEFLETSTASGLVLLAAVVAALAWVNSPWDGAYRTLFSTRFSIGSGDLAVAGDLRFWINEGLMAIFFLVAGLEIKRELTSGELRRPHHIDLKTGMYRGRQVLKVKSTEA